MKRIAKKTARQIKEESLEVLKTAKKQVVGAESPPHKSPAYQEKMSNDIGEGVSPEEKARIEARGRRRIEELEKEIEKHRQIRAQKDEARLGKEADQEKEEERKVVPPPEPSAKPKRGPFAGIRGQLERLKKRREIRMPPTG